MAKAVAKKTVPKKVAAKKEIKIKYTDKSKGQEHLIPVFDAIKKLMLPYKKGSLEVFGGEGGKIMLISRQPVEIQGRKHDDLWFASALIQKGYVGFYYMPVYCDPALKAALPKELMKCLKGKACFHIKKYDENILSQIDEALKIGYTAFKKRNWIG